jgi:Cys-tRNA synthase (O-phospho-L-seryl-tRNA:Cys-tRNA synthase)
MLYTENEDEFKKVRITVDELRKFKGFESVTDEKGEKVIDMLMTFTKICYGHLTEKK